MTGGTGWKDDQNPSPEPCQVGATVMIKLEVETWEKQTELWREAERETQG